MVDNALGVLNEKLSYPNHMKKRLGSQHFNPYKGQHSNSHEIHLDSNNNNNKWEAILEQESIEILQSIIEVLE